MVHGYTVGADDYLNKPFDIEVLLLKLDVIFNRSESRNGTLPTKEAYQVGEFNFDVSSRILKHPTTERKLSPKEGELLSLLCQHLEDVMPREKALRQIWDEDNYFTTRSMDVYITKLRKYLQLDAQVEIENVHSSGYKLYVKSS
jgi:DNA-binding response OmpR family regulator